MINAREQLLDIIRTPVNLKCASLMFGEDPRWYPDGEQRKIVLPLNYTHEEVLSFMEQMDFDYGHNGGDLYGTVWLKDGSWLTRDDDSEGFGTHWYYHKAPSIPLECIK